MSYFLPFPMVSFDGTQMPDITVSTIISSYGRDSFFEYTVQDDETPEMLAHRLYRNSEYASFILMMNDIVDPYEEWPLNSEALNQVVADNYIDPYSIHHYETLMGNIVSETYPEFDRIPVTNLEYETRKNDAKRDIFLLVPDLIASFAEQHKALLKV